MDRIVRLKEDIPKAVQVLKDGLPVIFPTDTVYGIGVIASNNSAIEDLYNLKKRPKDKPFALYFPNFTKVYSYIEFIPDYAKDLAEQYLPGALTMIFNSSLDLPILLVSSSNKIAIRIPDEELTLELLKQLNEPIAGTSANISGEKSALDAISAKNYFPKGIGAIIDGGSSKLKQESTIVDCSGPEPVIIRKGAIQIV